MSKSLAQRGQIGELTVADVQEATLDALINDLQYGTFSVLYQACMGRCAVEVIEAILDKGVDVNTKSNVRGI
jgi:hypothetical protein